MSPSDLSFWDAVDALREREPRYRREAYGFVVWALGVTVAALPLERRGDPERRHLSGRELLESVALLGRREFGVLAPTVFQEWGVERGEDVGRIVFQLVGCGQLSARPEDTLEDFQDFGLRERLAPDGDAARTRGRAPGEPPGPGTPR
jgi:uncharacterized repeat protein (TIGR04138 family)